MLQDTPASTNNAAAKTPAEHSVTSSLTPVPLSKGEGRDMLQDTTASIDPASTNDAADKTALAKTPAEHSTPLSFGEGQGGEAAGW